jgi:hypothetical protein
VLLPLCEEAGEGRPRGGPDPVATAARRGERDGGEGGGRLLPFPPPPGEMLALSNPAPPPPLTRPAPAAIDQPGSTSHRSRCSSASRRGEEPPLAISGAPRLGQRRRGEGRGPPPLAGGGAPGELQEMEDAGGGGYGNGERRMGRGKGEKEYDM